MLTILPKINMIMFTITMFIVFIYTDKSTISNAAFKNEIPICHICCNSNIESKDYDTNAVKKVSEKKM